MVDMERYTLEIEVPDDAAAHILEFIEQAVNGVGGQVDRITHTGGRTVDDD